MSAGWICISMLLAMPGIRKPGQMGVFFMLCVGHQFDNQYFKFDLPDLFSGTIA
jgi:hypothetical protein